jgi:predicted secreted protein
LARLSVAVAATGVQSQIEAMTWLTGVVVYILVWWVVLFAMLPLWVTPAEPGDLGHGSGAPQQPYMLRKLALTTAIAAVIWLGIYVVVSSPWLSFRTP